MKATYIATGVLLLAAVALATLAGFAAAGSSSDLPWSVRGHSSGNESSSANFALGSSSGQSIIGVSAGENNSLCSGFWCGVQCIDDSDGLDAAFELARVPQTNPCDFDTDDDGCWDGVELGDTEMLGGLREPTNFWDFYDVSGLTPGVPDGHVDLLFDVLGVINHFAPIGTEPEYDAHYDRGATAGPNAWNMTAPDGTIDLLIDILGVIGQFGHDCR